MRFYFYCDADFADERAGESRKCAVLCIHIKHSVAESCEWFMAYCWIIDMHSIPVIECSSRLAEKLMRVFCDTINL